MAVLYSSTPVIIRYSNDRWLLQSVTPQPSDDIYPQVKFADEIDTQIGAKDPAPQIWVCGDCVDRPNHWNDGGRSDWGQCWWTSLRDGDNALPTFYTHCKTLSMNRAKIALYIHVKVTRRKGGCSIATRQRAE